MSFQNPATPSAMKSLYSVPHHCLVCARVKSGKTEGPGQTFISKAAVDEFRVNIRRHARADTMANEYMQELPESVVEMVGAVYEMLTKGGDRSEGRGSLRSGSCAFATKRYQLL
jgi:hypothetical protein